MNMWSKKLYSEVTLCPTPNKVQNNDNILVITEQNKSLIPVDGEESKQQDMTVDTQFINNIEIDVVPKTAKL